MSTREQRGYQMFPVVLTGFLVVPTATGSSWFRGSKVAPNMALQRTRRPRIRSGRSLGSPLNARPLGGSPQTPSVRRS